MANIRGIELASEVYDLEDTSARDTATTASQTATQAGQTATQAEQTATQASQTATQASQTATTASETATQASQTATTASETATQASQTATAAQTTATQAQTTATQAKTTATQADDKAGQAALDASLAREEIGDITALETSDKSDLVSAINEVAAKETSIVFTCGYCQLPIPADGEEMLTLQQMSTLIGKRLLKLAVGQGVLIQGIAKRANATVGIPFSIFLERTASGFSKHEALDGTGLSVFLFSSSGTLSIANPGDSAITLFLNVVGINAFMIGD